MSIMNTEDTSTNEIESDVSADAIADEAVEAGSEVSATGTEDEGDLFDSLHEDSSMEASAKSVIGEDESEAEQETVSTEDTLGALPYQVNDDGSITVSMKVDGETFERTLSPESLVADLQKATAANKRFQEAKTLREEAESTVSGLGDAKTFYDAWLDDPVKGLETLMRLDPDRWNDATRRIQNEQGQTEVSDTQAERQGEEQEVTRQTDPFAALKESFEDNPEAQQLVELLEAENGRNKQLTERLEKMEQASENANDRLWAEKAQDSLDQISQSWEKEAPTLGLPSWDQDGFLDYMQTQPDPFAWEKGIENFKRINIDPLALKNAVVREMMEKRKREADLDVPRPAGRITATPTLDRYSKDPLFDQLLG